jgi:hypothetical protein
VVVHQPAYLLESRVGDGPGAVVSFGEDVTKVTVIEDEFFSSLADRAEAVVEGVSDQMFERCCSGIPYLFGQFGRVRF